jgi:cytochrome c oxidase subunit 2
MDRAEKADITLKVVGYQWYWGYSYPELGVEEFESRMIPTKDLKEGQLKLLEVDEPIYVPVGKTVKVMVTSDPLGVIHAWGIQSLGFKRDAIPGRVNEGWIKVDKEGTYYGQCYELCGVDHAFMPIKLVAVSEKKFNKWVKSKGGKIPGEEPKEIKKDTKQESKKSEEGAE